MPTTAEQDATLAKTTTAHCCLITLLRKMAASGDCIYRSVEFEDVIMAAIRQRLSDQCSSESIKNKRPEGT